MASPIRRWSIRDDFSRPKLVVTLRLALGGNAMEADITVVGQLFCFFVRFHFRTLERRGLHETRRLDEIKTELNGTNSEETVFGKGWRTSFRRSILERKSAEAFTPTAYARASQD